MSLRRIVTLLGFLIGFGGLILQFSISIPLRMSGGHDLLDALVFFFTYFTILTNIMLVLIYLSDLVGWAWLAWWRAPVTRGMMAGTMALVMSFYHLLLADLWDPEGLFLIANVLLHYVTPSLYILWWLFFQPKGSLKYGDIGWMLVPPAIWLAWAMARGAVVNEYPYPILEAHLLGYPQVAINIVVVLAILIVLFAVVIFIDRLLGRRQASPRG